MDWGHGKELTALETDQTWDFTSLPSEKTAIGCKWVYNVKFKHDGSVERCKARLVAWGNKQIHGKYFKHTFRHVAIFTIVRVIISLVAAMNKHLQQLDINNAFLYGYVDEK